MNWKHHLAVALGGLSLVLALGACGPQNDRNPAMLIDENPDSLATLAPAEKLQQDNAQVERNFGAYTYVVEMDDAKPKQVKTSVRTPQKLETPAIEVESNQAAEVPEIEVDLTAAIDDLRTDRPPLFGRACLTDAFPVRCSNEKIQAFFEANLDYPASAIDDGHNGWELVSFRITKDGKMEPGVSVIEHEHSCAGCAKAAAAIAGQMPADWAPALQDGKPVNVRVTLPVRFKTSKK